MLINEIVTTNDKNIFDEMTPTPVDEEILSIYKTVIEDSRNFSEPAYSIYNPDWSSEIIADLEFYYQSLQQVLPDTHYNMKMIHEMLSYFNNL